MDTRSNKFHNHLFTFEAGELAFHKNLMPCVIVGRDNPVMVSSGANDLEADAVCIKPGISHRVVFRKGGAMICYLDGVRLPNEDAPFESLDASWLQLPDAFETGDQKSLTHFRTLLEGSRPPPDPEVMKIVSQLYASPSVRMSQIDVARSLGLERTQALRHFKATTSQTFRKFKIWAAIVAAARNAYNGESIGLSGLDAGFSDAAHIARTAMTTFGLTPTNGLNGLKGFQTIE